MSTLRLTAPLKAVAAQCAKAAPAQSTLRPPSRRQARIQRKAAIRAFQDRLAADWPAVFCAFGDEPKAALAIGIDTAVTEHYRRDASVLTRRLFLRTYTRRSSYMRLLTLGAPRVALDGSVAGSVSALEAEHAQKVLQQRLMRSRGSRGTP